MTGALCTGFTLVKKKKTCIEQGQAWAQLHLLVEDQEVFCLIPSDPLGHLKERFPSVIQHHITSLLQLFIGPGILFLQFCDVAQVVIIHNLCNQIWQYSKYEIKKS